MSQPIQHLGWTSRPAGIAFDASRYAGIFLLFMKKIRTSFYIVLLFFFFLFLEIHSIEAKTIEYEHILITTDGEVMVMNKENDALYIGGTFSTVQVENGEIQPRTNIAAISIQNRALLSWDPKVTIEVRGIEFTEESVIAKNYLDTEADRTDKMEVIIDKATGSIEGLPSLTTTLIPTPTHSVATPIREGDVKGLMIDQSALGFHVPTLSNILTFAVRGFFVAAGLAALFYLLIGAFNWITSSGDKDAVQASRDKMQAAIIGVLMMVGVLAVVWTLEQVVFKGTICFGVSCPVQIPRLLEPIP